MTDDLLMSEKDLKRFYAKVVVDLDTGCWQWQHGLNASGYARFSIRGKRSLAHRISCWTFNDPFDLALDIDHLCRNRGCVAPDHLEPVTRLVNLARGETRIRDNLLKTECPKCGSGYHYAGRGKHRSRRCRDCTNEIWRQGYYRRKAA